MSGENETSLEDQFPSIDLVYPIALNSYDAMAKRFDALDGRIQTMTAFAVTACLAVPALGKAQNLPFNSVWFILAMCGIALATLLSIYARLIGKVRVLNPTNLWQDSLHLPQPTFKTYAIYYASEAFKVNNARLERKWRMSVGIMTIFVLSLCLLLLWVSRGNLT